MPASRRSFLRIGIFGKLFGGGEFKPFSSTGGIAALLVRTLARVLG